MAFWMHIGLETDRNVPKWAILRLIAEFYPFKYSYVGCMHPQCKPSCGSSPCTLLLTLNQLHGVADAHRLHAKPEMRQKAIKSPQFWRFLGHFWTI